MTEDRECGINRRGKMLTGFWWKNVSEKRKTVEDLGLHWENNIRMDEEQIDMDWICLVPDTDWRQAVMNSVVNWWVQ
jgi:hypothetical protein